MTEEKVAIEEVKCKEEGCKGVINRSITVRLKTGCYSTTPAHPCNGCGCLHWGEEYPFGKDSPVKYYDDLKVFRDPKDEELILKDENNQFVSSFNDYVAAERGEGEIINGKLVKKTNAGA